MLKNSFFSFWANRKRKNLVNEILLYLTSILRLKQSTVNRTLEHLTKVNRKFSFYCGRLCSGYNTEQNLPRWTDFFFTFCSILWSSVNRLLFKPQSSLQINNFGLSHFGEFNITREYQTVRLTSCSTGFESAAWQLTIFVFICKTG